MHLRKLQAGGADGDVLQLTFTRKRGAEFQERAAEVHQVVRDSGRRPVRDRDGGRQNEGDFSSGTARKRGWEHAAVQIQPVEAKALVVLQSGC